MTLNARIALVTTLWCGIVGATGGNREAGQVGSNADGLSKSQPTAAASNQQTERHRNACDLLTVEEVSAVVGAAPNAVGPQRAGPNNRSSPSAISPRQPKWL